MAGPESGGGGDGQAGRREGKAPGGSALSWGGSGSPPVSPGEAPGPQRGLAHGSPPGLAYICEGLKEQKKGLETLVLWNNQLTHTGMAFLGMTLVSRAGSGEGRLSAPCSAPRPPSCSPCPSGTLCRSPFSAGCSPSASAAPLS